MVVDAQRPELRDEEEKEEKEAKQEKTDNVDAAKASLSGRRCLAVRAGPKAQQEAFVNQFWDCVVGRFETGGR